MYEMVQSPTRLGNRPSDLGFCTVGVFLESTSIVSSCFACMSAFSDSLGSFASQVTSMPYMVKDFHPVTAWLSTSLCSSIAVYDCNEQYQVRKNKSETNLDCDRWCPPWSLVSGRHSMGLLTGSTDISLQNKSAQTHMGLDSLKSLKSLFLLDVEFEQGE